MEWFLDGLGTEIISLLIGGLIGGVTGYKIGIIKNSNKQKIENNSNQTPATKSIVAGGSVIAGGDIKVGNNDGNKE